VGALELEPEGKVDLYHVWDVTRRSVEQFDKNIGDIRKMCLSVTGIVVSASAYILSRADSVNVTNTLMWMGSFIMGMAVVFWILDDHYHTYLRITANVCTNLENMLGLSSIGVGVSTELGKYRNGINSKYPKYLTRALTDIVYISIGTAAILAIIIINIRGGTIENNLIWVSIDIIAFISASVAILRPKFWMDFLKMVGMNINIIK
jgi:hypothetical protein